MGDMERNPSAASGYSPAPTWSDSALCRIIWDTRQSTGACGLRQLCRITGQSPQATSERLNTLRKRGLVTWTKGVNGSIRTTDETLYRKPC